jgi:hypothetical protein
MCIRAEEKRVKATKPALPLATKEYNQFFLLLQYVSSRSLLISSVIFGSRALWYTSSARSMPS